MKVPNNSLVRLLLQPVPLKSMSSKTTSISDVQRVRLTKMSNEGGCYYCFGITTTSETLYMYPPTEDDAHLLKREIKSWLNIE